MGEMKYLGSVHTDFLPIALAMLKWVDYLFLANSANAFGKMSMWYKE